MFLAFKALLRMAMFVSELLEVLSWNELELLMQSTRRKNTTGQLHTHLKQRLCDLERERPRNR